MLFCLQAYDYAHFLFFLHFITYWLLLWTKRHSNCQTIVISFKNLREALDEPFRENGKRFCINFFFKSQPKPYRGLGKKKKAIGESSNFHSSGIVLGASACTHSYTYHTYTSKYKQWSGHKSFQLIRSKKVSYNYQLVCDSLAN